jgi:hypothetical protein
LYGLTPPTHIPYFPEDYMVEADDNYLTTREEMSRPNLQSAQHMMVHVENQKRSERTFETEDLVLSQIATISIKKKL